MFGASKGVVFIGYHVVWSRGRRRHLMTPSHITWITKAYMLNKYFHILRVHLTQILVVTCGAFEKTTFGNISIYICANIKWMEHFIATIWLNINALFSMFFNMGIWYVTLSHLAFTSLYIIFLHLQGFLTYFIYHVYHYVSHSAFLVSLFPLHAY